MVNQQSVEFRPITISEGESFISLMNRTYTRKKTREYFKWQFFDSPLRTTLMGGFLNNRLIGCFGLQYHQLSNNLIGGQAIDLIVDDAFRRKGIFSKLGKTVMNYFGNSLDFYFSLANASGREALEKGLDYKTIMVIKTSMLSGPVRKLDSRLAKIIENWDDPVIKRIENTKKTNGIGLYFIRGPEELKWRFGDNPNYRYSIIEVDGNAFAIVKIFVDPVSGENFGDIVDFGFRIEAPDLLEALFCAAVNYLITKGATEITSWATANGEVLRRVLHQIGFEETNQERYFCLKVSHPGHDYLYDASNWFLVPADAEIY